MSSRQVELVVRRSGQPEWRRVLAQGVTQMGRAEDNDLVLPDIGVSRRHARIVVDRDEVRIEDLGSGNGTFFKGRRVDSQVLSEGDEVVVDPFTLVFHFQGGKDEDDETLRAEGEEAPAIQLLVLAGHRLAPAYPLLATGLGLGRSPAQDIVLFDPAASRDHARVEARADGLWLFDRGSANGTYVNGERVNGTQRLSAGDHIRIGATEFRLEVGAGAAAAPAKAAPAPAPPPARSAAPSPVEGRTGPTPAPARPAAPPAAPPPAAAPPAAAWAPPAAAAPAPRAPAAAPAPRPPAGQKSMVLPVVIAAGVGLLLVLGLVAAAGFAALQLRGGGLPGIGGGATAELPPPHQTPAAQVDELERLMSEGAQAKALGRTIEAVSKYYKVTQDVDPLSPEARRRGLEACELITFGELRADLRRRGLDEKAKKDLLKATLTKVAEVEKAKTGLHPARVEVEAALAVLPGDKELVAARGRLNKLVTEDRSSEAGKKVISEVDGHLRAARTAVAAGDWTAAKASYEAAIAADPDLRTAGVFRAQEGLAQAEARLR